ncbi:hypothetical protein J7L81_05150, partial [Candidatus Aerophobetes bacterium]|nr:hypothetical protein [Candidatus Aerophobetes bacterium]
VTGVREEMGEEIFKVFTSGASAALGLGIGELGAEYAAKTTGVTGLRKVGLKGAVRCAIGAIFYAISVSVGGFIGFLFFMMAAGSVGGIVLDAIEYFVPGGFRGMAEELAVRSMAAGYAAERLAEHAVPEGVPEVVEAVPETPASVEPEEEIFALS